MAIKDALDLSAKGGKNIPSRDNGMNKVSEVGKRFFGGKDQDHFDHEYIEVMDSFQGPCELRNLSERAGKYLKRDPI